MPKKMKQAGKRKGGTKYRPKVGTAKSNYSARTTSAPARNPDARRQTGIPRKKKKRGGR